MALLETIIKDMKTEFESALEHIQPLRRDNEIRTAKRGDGKEQSKSYEGMRLPLPTCPSYILYGRFESFRLFCKD